MHYYIEKMWFSSLIRSLFYLNNYMKINNQVVTMVIGIKWVITGGSNNMLLIL